MDNLRPERDELDQFRDRSAKQVVKPKSSAAQPAPVTEKRKSANSLPLYGLLTVLLIGIAALAWMYLQQQDMVQQLRAEQEQAAGFIGQSKLLLARLEGQVSETGAELEQTGSATDQKLAFLDSEVRKLWAIANDRNKKAIEANQVAVTKLAERIAQLEQQGKTQLAEVKLLQSTLTERLDKVSAQSQDVAGSLNGVSNRLAELASNSVAALSEVESLSQELQELRGLKTLPAKVKEMDRDLASVDASRQQLVQRVVDIERRLNQHQFKPSSGGLQLEQPTKN